MDEAIEGRLRPHRVVREVIRHYPEFAAHCAQSGSYDIEYADISISLSDLKGCLAGLSPRLSQAVYYNVIHDKSQKETAKLMDITPISVGQYVDKAMRKIANDLFGSQE